MCRKSAAKRRVLPSPEKKLEFYVRWVSLKEISCYPWGTWHRGISCDLRGTRHKWSRVGEQRTPHTIPACTSMHQASCIQVKYHMYVSAKLFSSCKGPPGNSAIHKVSQTRAIGALPKLETKCEVQMKTVHVTKKQKQVIKLVF
jgi:hypothetical protein